MRSKPNIRESLRVRLFSQAAGSVVLLILLCAAIGVLAQEATPRADSSGFSMSRLRNELAAPDTLGRTTASAPRVHESLSRLAVRITIYLIIVILAILALAWLSRKAGIAGGSKLGGGSMDTLETLPIGQNKSVALVRVVDAVYVLAHTANSITVIEKIEGQRALEIIASSKGLVSVTKFKDAFNQFVGKLKK